MSFAKTIQKGLLLFTLAIYGTAQSQNVDELGEFRQEELDLKVCSFDPDAAAMYLDYHASADHNGANHLVTRYHIRLKILKESALDEANVVIPFYHNDDFEFISEFDGVTISPGVNGRPVYTKLENKSIFTKKENEYYSTMRIAFPAVKVGSIIDYKFTSTMKSYAGLEKWVFQHFYPVARSSYYLVILPNIEFSYSIQKLPNYHIDIKPDREKGAISFSIKDLPGFTNEAYMDTRDDYLTRVDFQLSRTYTGKKYMENWDQVASEFWSEKYFGKQLNEKLSEAKPLLTSISQLPTPLEKMTALYRHLQKNYTWNGIESRYSIDGIKRVWEKRNGSSGDLNLLLINLLQQAGLPAEPLLVSRRSHGKVYPNIPFADQFSTVFAYVKINDKEYILDLSNPQEDIQLFPVSVLNTTGLIVRKKEGQLLEIKPKEALVIMTNLTLVVDPDKMHVEGNQYCTGYGRLLRLKEWQSSPTTYKKQYFETAGNLSMTQFEVVNELIDSLPLEHRFKFEMETPSTGDYLFIPLDLITGMDDKNPFISNNRFSDINFGYKQTILINLIIHLPEGYKLESLPKPVSMTNPDKSISLSRLASQTNSGMIMVRFELKLNRGDFYNSEYGMIREFYKKIYELHDEKIAIKKS